MRTLPSCIKANHKTTIVLVHMTSAIRAPPAMWPGHLDKANGTFLEAKRSAYTTTRSRLVSDTKICCDHYSSQTNKRVLAGGRGSRPRDVHRLRLSSQDVCQCYRHCCGALPKCPCVSWYQNRFFCWRAKQLGMEMNENHLVIPYKDSPLKLERWKTCKLFHHKVPTAEHTKHDVA